MHSISYLSACCLCCLSDSLSVCAPVEPAIKSLFQEQQLRDVEEQQEPEVQSATDAVAQAAIETDALEMPGGSGSMHLAASHEVVHDFPPQSEQPVQWHVAQLSEEGADISDSVPAVGFGGDDEEDDEEGDEPDDDDDEDKEEDDDDEEDDEPDDDDHQEEEHRAADHHPRRRVSRPAEDGPDRNDDDDSAAAMGAVPEEMSRLSCMPVPSSRRSLTASLARLAPSRPLSMKAASSSRTSSAGQRLSTEKRLGRSGCRGACAPVLGAAVPVGGFALSVGSSGR